MNPLIRFIVKQLEENAAIIEKTVKPRTNMMKSDFMDPKELDVKANVAFDELHHSIGIIKSIVTELF